MTSDSEPVLAVSTWSVHRAIGIAYTDSPAADIKAPPEERWGPGAVPIMQIPESVAALGIDRLEIVSFHIDGDDAGFLDELRSAIAAAGITLQTLLIDDGDVTDPVHGERDIAWIGRWIDIAARLGAEKARVIGGKQPPARDVLDRSVAGLAELARRGADQGVRILTENWLTTMAGPDQVQFVLDRLDGMVGFLADFGNWKGPTKYDDLATVLPRAENSHLHGVFNENLEMDTEDFEQCLNVAREVGYKGSYTLIYSGPSDDEWEALRGERDFVRAFFANAAQ